MNPSMPRLFCAVAMIVVTLPTPADASAPGGRYVVKNGGTSKGTVYDTKTKLTWQQAIPSTTYTWAEAETYCAGVGRRLGGKGWRLPTISELQSIIDFSQTAAPMIDSNAFPSTPASDFWSSTPSATSSGYAMTVDFLSGVSDGYVVDGSVRHTNGNGHWVE